MTQARGGSDRRPRALEAESASEQRLRALLEGMLDPVVTIDGRGRILEASRSVRRVFGYRPEELVGKNVKQLMTEPHRSQHDDYLARYRETGETGILGQTREFEVRHKDGRTIVCELSVSRVDLPGEKPQFIGSFRDVTDRKEAEAKLRESEQRLRAIFDQEVQFVGLLDLAGNVIEVNQAALDLAQTTRAEVVGRPFWETCWWSFSEDARARLREAVQRAAGGELVRYETEYMGRGDERVQVDFSLKPVRDEQGEVVLLLPEGRDITFLKHAQRRETAMLRALATIGESASILAHEIKTPITAIHFALKAVAEKLGEDHREVLEDLVGRLAKLERTMRRTLSFAKPLQVSLKPSAPRDVLENVARLMRPHLEQALVDWTIEADEDLPEVLVDGGLIEEVLSNLVRNAIESIGERGRIVLRARVPGTMVRLEVEDDGPGIAESIRPHLFKPFVSTKAGGTGLGLALCRKIVEEHGGSITVDQGELGGARFKLLLPRADLGVAGSSEPEGTELPPRPGPKA